MYSRTKHLRIAWLVGAAMLVIFAVASPAGFSRASNQLPGLFAADRSERIQGNTRAYLPVLFSADNYVDNYTARVNAPYFADQVVFQETAIFWFGSISDTDNYADVRVGYTSDDLYIRLGVIDRYLWYDTEPQSETLADWDAVSLYLDTAGNIGDAPAAPAFQFVGQLNWWEPRSGYQAAYQGNGSGWQAVDLPFTAKTLYRGDAPNNPTEDRGWAITYTLPLANFGALEPPPDGTVWGLGLALHDRDDAAGTPIADKTWPPEMDPLRPETWGQMRFGLPVYIPPDVEPGGSTLIRQGDNGQVVLDGEVGGGTVCGYGLDIWSEWPVTPQPGADKTNDQLNIQNQYDITDWPCFAKYYVTFPLGSIPTGQEIISATLTLHQFSNAGGGERGDPPISLIQVLTVNQDWDEATLTWNNAPLARENVSRSWVEPLLEFPGWPGVPRNWDVSGAVAEAYARGEPLRLALYSADAPMHTGKYFTSSDIGDWDAAGRPALLVTWGSP